MFNAVLSTNRYEFARVYSANEALAEFYNRRFVSKAVFRMSDEHEKLIRAYSDIFDATPGIKPRELMIKGIEGR